MAAALVVVALVGCQGKLARHAGTGVAGYSGDGGPAAQAQFDTVTDLVPIPGGGFYAIDSARCVIRKVPFGAPVTTVAGTGECGDDGDGPDAASRRINPRHSSFTYSQLVLEADGSLLFADIGNGVIRRVGTDGSLTTVAGSGSPGANDHGYCRSGRWFPTGVAVAPDGTIYAQCFWDGLFRVEEGAFVPVRSGGTVGGAYGGGLEADASGRLWWGTITVPSVSTPTLRSYDPATGTTTSYPLPSDASALAIGTDGRPVVAYGNRVWRVFDDVLHQPLAGTGAPDPGGSIHHGVALDFPLSPTALGIGPNGLFVASASVIYHSIPPGPPVGRCDLAGPGADLTDADLSWCDLAGVDLSGADLSGADLGRADLRGADLSGAVVSATTSFRFTDLRGADLGSVDLGPLAEGSVDGVVSGAISGTPIALPARWVVTPSGHLVAPGVVLDGADLSGADLTGASLARASLAATDLAGAVLTGVASGSVVGTPATLPTGWQVANGYLVGPGADLYRAVLGNLDLAGQDLSGANLDRTALTDTNLAGADLRGARLASPTLVRTNLSGADLRGAVITGTIPTAAVSARDIDLTGANLDGVALGGFTSLTGVRGVGIVGTPATLPTTSLFVGGLLISQAPNLDGLDLTGLDLRGARLTDGRVQGTVFTGADLDGADAYALVGTPAALPGPGYQLVGSSIVGPGINLAWRNYRNQDLTGVDLTGTDLWLTDFTGATGTPTGGASVLRYNQTKCPDGSTVSSPTTCVGRGFAA